MGKPWFLWPTFGFAVSMPKTWTWWVAVVVQALLDVVVGVSIYVAGGRSRRGGPRPAPDWLLRLRGERPVTR